jgi:hypothetical protein
MFRVAPNRMCCQLRPHVFRALLVRPHSTMLGLGLEGTEMKRKPKAKSGRTQRAKKRQARSRPSVKSRAPKKQATPSARSLAEKLRVRAGTAIAVLNCPKPPEALLGPMPEKASVQLTLDNPADLVLLFVRNSQELGQHVQTIADKLSSALDLWVAYPKQSSEIETDLTRDAGWDPMHRLGWGVVSLVSVDETWTAMRFKVRAGD